MAGQSDPHISLFSAAEIEFVAEDELVEIVPNISMEPLNFTCGDFGPFRPQMPTEVPMWLAVALKKRGKCVICPPQWMSVDKLTQVLEAERDTEYAFEPLPFHYVELSRLLFDHAHEDIPDLYMVRTLIEDIRDVRFHKLESSLKLINERVNAVKLKNVSAMEMNIVRPFLVRTLQSFYKLDSPQMIHNPVTTAYRQAQAADRGPRRELRRR